MADGFAQGWCWSGAWEACECVLPVCWLARVDVSAIFSEAEQAECVYPHLLSNSGELNLPASACILPDDGKMLRCFWPKQCVRSLC